MANVEQIVAAARAALRRGDLLTAKMAAEEAVRVGPKSFEAAAVMGEVLLAGGRAADAESVLRRAVGLRPASAEAKLQLGLALISVRKPAEAEVELRRACALKPTLGAAHAALAKVEHTQKRLDAAIEAAGRAVALDPADQRSLVFLGGCLIDAGRIDEAVSTLRKAVAIPEFNPLAVSNLLMALNYQEGDPLAVKAEHERLMDGILAKMGRLGAAAPPFANTPEPDRRLTVCFLSPDFHNHVCARFMEPLIERLDRSRFRVVCYADVGKPDEVTARFKGWADLWRDVRGGAGWKVAEAARADGIDIMIDCAGHTGANRLDIPAWRAAPVQCTWLGYPNTTGLRTMDWRIVDGESDPAGSEAHCTERLLRLERCAWCYRPPAKTPEPGGSPAAMNGFVTFGSFNNLSKVTPRVLAAWGEILRRRPEARLVLKNRWLESRQVSERVLGELTSAGARPEQVRVLEYTPSAEYLRPYESIDVQLDPFPYNGTTTTCESLWMGVPVLTVEGTVHAGRVGASLLRAAGMESFVTPSVDAYVARAEQLASNPGELIGVRPGLREKMAAGPLRDETGYAVAFGAALRRAWGEWCRDRTR